MKGKKRNLSLLITQKSYQNVLRIMIDETDSFILPTVYSMLWLCMLSVLSF